MASPPKNPTEAQALKAKREADGKKAMAEYEANAEAVRRAGVDTRRIVLGVYMLSSAAAALAGIVLPRMALRPTALHRDRPGSPRPR